MKFREFEIFSLCHENLFWLTLIPWECNDANAVSSLCVGVNVGAKLTIYFYMHQKFRRPIVHRLIPMPTHGIESCSCMKCTLRQSIEIKLRCFRLLTQFTSQFHINYFNLNLTMVYCPREALLKWNIDVFIQCNNNTFERIVQYHDKCTQARRFQCPQIRK